VFLFYSLTVRDKEKNMIDIQKIAAISAERSRIQTTRNETVTKRAQAGGSQPSANTPALSEHTRQVSLRK
jgi:hypothetical protein